MTLSAAFSRTVRPAHLRRIVELVREIVGRQRSTSIRRTSSMRL